MSNLSKLRKIVKEALGDTSVLLSPEQYTQQITALYDMFRGLEAHYNKFDLLQLKNEYHLPIILEKAKELEVKYNNLYKSFRAYENVHPEDEEWFSRAEDRIFELGRLKDSFVGDLESLQDAFTAIGDLDKGSHWFKEYTI